MEIKVEGIEIKENQFEAIVKVQGLTTQSNSWYETGRAIERLVIERVVEKATKDFLQNHLQEIIGKIDQQHILNMVVLNSAKRISQ